MLADGGAPQPFHLLAPAFFFLCLLLFSRGWGLEEKEQGKVCMYIILLH
jgi:hypothetical protein